MKNQIQFTRPHVIITVEGGIIQGVLTDHPCDVTVIDYDAEGLEEDKIVQVPDLDGSLSDAYVFNLDPDVQSDWHERLLCAIEQARKAVQS